MVRSVSDWSRFGWLASEGRDGAVSGHETTAPAYAGNAIWGGEFTSSICLESAGGPLRIEVCVHGAGVWLIFPA